MSDREDLRLPWIIVGFGRVGQTLTLLADRLDVPIAATWNRTEAAARDAAVDSPNPCFGDLPEALDDSLDEPRLVWLTVVDDAIVEVFEILADRISPGSIVAHTSGSLPSTEIAPHTDLPVGSLHPLQAIANPHSAVDQLADSFWTVEGDDQAVDSLESVVAPAGIEPTRIEPAAKTLYHASAATAANLLVGLLDASIDIGEHAGLDRSEARRALVQLARTSLDNLAEQPPADALTGPAARGDHETIEDHRRALGRLDDDSLLELYELLTRRALNLGED